MSSRSSRSRLRTVRRLAGAVVVGALFVACSDGSSDSVDPDQTSTTGADTTPATLAAGSLDDPAAGAARVALASGLDVTLDVVACSVDLGAEPEGEVPAELVAVRAEGETTDGTPVLLDITRFRSEGAATTITDNVTVLEGSEDAPVSFVVAQRFEVGGQVTDGRDPDAREPLLRITGDVIRARGIFAPPGAFAGDPGAVEGAVAVACP